MNSALSRRRFDCSTVVNRLHTYFLMSKYSISIWTILQLSLGQVVFINNHNTTLTLWAMSHDLVVIWWMASVCHAPTEELYFEHFGFIQTTVPKQLWTIRLGTMHIFHWWKLCWLSVNSAVPPAWRLNGVRFIHPGFKTAQTQLMLSSNSMGVNL